MTDPSLTKSDSVVRANGVLCADIDGEVVALNAEKGMCYALDPIGSYIWSIIAQAVSIADLCALLTRRYRVDPADCARDVMDLLEDLRGEGLVTLSPSPSPV